MNDNDICHLHSLMLKDSACMLIVVASIGFTDTV